MTNPVVLITGGLTGIGWATAQAFARQGADVVVSGRHDEEGEALAGELRSAGVRAAYVHTDVRRDDEVRRLVDGTIERFGHLDVAVNNAGTQTPTGPLQEQSPDTYASTFDTNVLGVILSMKHELRAMLPQHRGSIVNVSSVAGHIGMPDAAVYVASKHAVEGLTKSAALETATEGVRVNAVAPGATQTGMLDRYVGTPEGRHAFEDSVPARRFGTPDEIAQAIVFLGSDQASYITGQVVSVDGGYSAR
ncbi:SDR family oxidoreductase [Dactylosporangium fulvum]|uniref:SDR family oxidoreductase n=1 Tax=Dactylosporangium fulvum TaxID=53359 RepID=A0ABY5VS44_9ACTN|nr:SDR family NAD(P)-dependent oxidoreductase [Dactylosporangium fulvum]UWP78641.1 SDR family oxidoreductase [Dactylosporangium fulvum]